MQERGYKNSELVKDRSVLHQRGEYKSSSDWCQLKAHHAMKKRRLGFQVTYLLGVKIFYKFSLAVSRRRRDGLLLLILRGK